MGENTVTWSRTIPSKYCQECKVHYVDLNNEVELQACKMEYALWHRGVSPSVGTVAQVFPRSSKARSFSMKQQHEVMSAPIELSDGRILSCPDVFRKGKGKHDSPGKRRCTITAMTSSYFDSSQVGGHSIWKKLNKYPRGLSRGHGLIRLETLHEKRGGKTQMARPRSIGILLSEMST
ncbi:hypothetical protein SODALDRAFT_32376 [Sodiomyces alkalinus F11]|uniref:Uncharacterized protein n=1 Tax=Sodiomyces alkalinus (strain CBS 110278 / VKM F-3762 / F11) TaxID=1314773 RepID=A0A3N2Q8V4_SODAK|nr:hypothetical protein SODALDRAFT_32376 [Sodiomyces alkalinus F11]ROT43170.1 hypothetical protein SODALDRAFT_32376 [Sodiomyces alkalinus F11]